MRKLTTMSVALVVTLGVLASFSLSHANAPDPTIKKVMKAAFNKKSGICGVVLAGKASVDQKRELLTLFEQLSEAKPPKGDPTSWKQKTGALVEAATAVTEGKRGAGVALKNAANCKGCHDAHKG